MQRLVRICLTTPAAKLNMRVIARQQLSPVYHRNGASYAITRDCLLVQQSILGKNASAVVTLEHLVSIDTLEDFEVVESVLRARGKTS